MEEVIGSIPIRSTNKPNNLIAGVELRSRDSGAVCRVSFLFFLQRNVPLTLSRETT
jgi:hypothetical protein